MENDYGNKNTSDVIVYLIPSSTTVESGDTGWKPKRNAESSEALLVTLNVHSERLRHCSKYFQILLDKRWADSNRKSPMEFSLEVHTNVKYYEDCFLRMYTPNFTGIPSVEHAMELLKVASQIEYEELMDASMGYLSVVPWSDVEESKIRKFPFSTYISSGELRELNERLWLLHESEEESYLCLYEVGLDYLRSSLESALDSAGHKDSQVSCAIFADAFYDIVQSKSCYDLAKVAYALVIERAEAVLSKTAEEVIDSYFLESNFKMICWLLEILLQAKGTKELVKHTVRDKFFVHTLQDKSDSPRTHFFSEFEWPVKWMITLLSIFEEVLAGRLLLESSERVSLFSDWEWFMFDGTYEDKLSEAALHTLGSFMMTLPHEHQLTKLKERLSQALSRAMS